MNIKSIHHCTRVDERGTHDGDVFVQREDGNWYRITRPGEVHLFAEVGRWDEDCWARHREDPPCARRSLPL